VFAHAQEPLRSLNSHAFTFDQVGLRVVEERILDRGTGSILSRAVDTTNRVVDVDSLRQSNHRLTDERLVKFGGDLIERMKLAEQMQVVFWLQRPAAMPDLRRTLDARLLAGSSAEDARRHALDVAERHVTPLVESFAAVLRDAGYTPDHVDRHAPIVFVTLPVGAIEGLAKRAEVDKVYWSSPQWMDESMGGSRHESMPNEWASPSARTDHVHRLGVTGAGVKVLVNDTAQASSNNPFLPPMINGRTGSAASHATAVSGIIASTHTQHTGAAPGLPNLYNYGASGDTNAPIAWSWGMQQGISFGNCSWWNGQRGSINFLDRYFDYIIRNFAVMLFKSAGNQGIGQAVTTPGNGFNMIASGCADDRNTHDWDDDIIASFSSTANPTQGHEKPEVVAHGTAITTTTTSSPWIGSAGSGTSYASPVTCGVAALLAATDNALLAKPEVIKAMLMAGAWNDVHGSGVLSDYDGAGGINAAASQKAVSDLQYVAASLDASSFVNGIWSRNLDLVGGDETRIVGLWFSSADSSYATDVLQMDLDMTVEDPNGVVVATSASLLNPFEIVQFVPATSGTYTVKMHRMRFLGTTEPFALAWSTAQDAATDVMSFTGTPSIGSTLTFEFFDRYHPGQAYLALLSLTPPPAVTPLPVGKVLGFGFDGLSAASFSAALPGFLGNFDSTGRASANFAIPFAPALVGVQIWFGMATAQAGQPVAEETSAVGSFVIQ
jgi:hypothetical protein